MRNLIILSFLFSLFLAGIYGCQKEEIDDQKPIIDLRDEDTFPLSCDTVYFGEPFTIQMSISDNKELGSFNISIHHNFDHHSHSTEVTACDLWPVKSPVNPFVLIQDYSIPSGTASYQINQILEIPLSNENGIFDEGDYHFFISLTDKEGWSTQKGLSIKMLQR
jgi:hypothetical protein